MAFLHIGIYMFVSMEVKGCVFASLLDAVFD